MKWFPTFEFLATAALLAVAGCQSASRPPLLHGEHFVPDDQPHSVDNVAAAQAARGARADATLYSCHFNDAGLNSTGRQKLELMLEDEDPAQPLVVYLDLPAGADLAPAHQMVTDYLKARGLPENQIKLVDGPNPRTLHPSADALTGLANLQQTQGAGAPQCTAIGATAQQSTGYGAGPSDNTNH